MRASVALVFAAAALAVTTRAALADLQYDVHGEDVYRVGPAGTISRVVYTGTQRLAVERNGNDVRYDAQASYTRESADGRTTADARFVQELEPNGTFEDRIDDDPDFLTILNQPFAVQLDGTTMRDLRSLHGAVPFNASSPLGGSAVLRGFLRPGTPGEIGGRAVVAVRFEAQGPMTGPLPDRGTAATMAGRMRMDGIAYYAVDDAMLLALDATLTIVAKLQEPQATVPVHITYRRFIRASTPAAKTPPPTPLATGGGTGSPPVP